MKCIAEKCKRGYNAKLGICRLTQDKTDKRCECSIESFVQGIRDQLAEFEGVEKLVKKHQK